MVITNLANKAVSPLVSVLCDIPTGDSTFPRPCLIKNISGDDVEVEIQLEDTKSFIKTIIYEGWNPEIVVAIKGAPAGLQRGY